MKRNAPVEGFTDFIHSQLDARVRLQDVETFVRELYCWEVMRRNSWSYTRSAAALGVHRNTLARIVAPAKVKREKRGQVVQRRFRFQAGGRSQKSLPAVSACRAAAGVV